MSKEGSGRVAIMRATGLLRSYTLECNYNTGRTYNPTPPSPLDHRKSPPASLPTPPKYNPSVFEDVREIVILFMKKSILAGNIYICSYYTQCPRVAAQSLIRIVLKDSYKLPVVSVTKEANHIVSHLFT